METTHLLIVNGGGHNDFHGDFFRLVGFFGQCIRPDFQGEFWTCDDPNEYLKNSPFSDIKFGGDDVVFSKTHSLFQQDQKDRNWVYVAPADLVDLVTEWLKKKSDPRYEFCAKANDSVIVIFISHGFGTKQGSSITGHSLHLGQNKLSANDLVPLLRQFPTNVQIDVLSNACYSGIFSEKVKADGQRNRWISTAAKLNEEASPAPRSSSNRYRNGLFVAGLVRSLGGFTTLKTPPSLRYVKDELPKATQAHPLTANKSTVLTYHDVDVRMSIEMLLFRQFADFPVVEENIAARRRIERQQHYLESFSSFPMSPPREGFFDAVTMIRSELESFGQTEEPYSEGYFVSAAMGNPEYHLADLLRGFMWRGRWQSNVFQTFMELCLHSVCDLSALAKPVDYFSKSPKWIWVQSALACWPVFDELQQDGITVAHMENRYAQWQEFPAPIGWLAAMIVRSATNLTDAFDVIYTTQFFGDLDIARLQNLPERDFEPERWQPEPDDSVSTSSTVAPYLGMMLPEGLDMTDPANTFEGISQRFYERLNRIEVACEEYFDVPQDKRFSLGYQDNIERDARDYNCYNG
ncbi:MAG: hypothetical protein Q9224_003609 [Gallowayella concinna]